MLSPLKQTALALACCGLIVPTTVLYAAPPQRASSVERAALQVVDVQLGADGLLRGQLVNAQAMPIAAADVTLVQNGRPLAMAKTDEHGGFGFQGVRGGTYLLSSAGTHRICRIWMHRTAPPHAVAGVLLNAGDPIVRGQCRVYDWFELNPVIGYTAVAAAIAVPIILANDDDNPPPSS